MKVKNKILTMVALTVLTCATYSSIGYADTSDKNTDTSVVTTTLSEEKRSDELDQSSTGSSSENESSSSSEPETNPSTNPPTTEPSQPSPSEENKPDGSTKIEIGNNKDISSGTKVLISEDSIKNFSKASSDQEEVDRDESSSSKANDEKKGHSKPKKELPKTGDSHSDTVIASTGGIILLSLSLYNKKMKLY
ncbi:TPA: LPXTG cell wall anchor domain-containing protein [Streptococcus agalactiae]|nr:LPXTG cell wall anchor domain-containing protein [Streptococcus agalactiae]